MRSRATLVLIGILSFASCVGAASAGSTGHAPAATGTISGVIRDADGRPIVGALVAAVPENDGIDEASTRPAGLVRSDKAGRFRLAAIPPGRYSVTATFPGLPAALSLGKSLGSGQTLRGIDLRFGVGGLTLRGVVTDAMGRPLADAQIRAMRYSKDLGDLFYTWTKSDGSYEVTLPRAVYYVAAARAGYDFVGVNSDSTTNAPVNLALDRATRPGPPPPSVVDWIRTNAVPLRSVEAGHGFEDLEPLRETIGSARVVALGEATHGTREFFQLKHRLLEFLVARMGFDVFAIEATMPEAFDVNDYVLTGHGDPEQALSGLYFWTWDTQEVLDLIHWMRRWNSDPSHVKKVKFYGIDMQSPPRAAKSLLRGLDDLDLPESAAARHTLGELANPYLSRPAIPSAPFMSASTTIDSVLRDLAVRFDALRPSDRIGEPARLHLRQDVRILQQWKASWSRPGVRDLAMAENVRWVLNVAEPGCKMVLWAHNLHVTKCPAGDGGNGMGADLAATLKKDLVVFGFVFDRGGFQAIDGAVSRSLRPFEVGPAREGSLDDAFARAGLSLAAVDLRRLPVTGDVREWFSARQSTRDIGSGFQDSMSEQYYARFAPIRAYDAILYVDSTSTARSTPRGRVTPPVVTAAPSNLDFESGPLGSAPPGWSGPTRLTADNYRADLQRDESRSGSRCGVLRRRPEGHYGESYASLTQSLDAAAYRGKRVRFSAMVRVDAGNSADHAYLSLRSTSAPARTSAPGRTTFADGMEDRPITGRTWKRYEVEGTIPEETAIMTLGLSFVGDGSAWFDDATLETMEAAKP